YGILVVAASYCLTAYLLMGIQILRGKTWMASQVPGRHWLWPTLSLWLLSPLYFPFYIRRRVMKKLLGELAFIAVVAAIAIYGFGERPADVAKEVAWTYGLMGLVALVLGIYIAWALTRAMNPRIKPPVKKQDSEDVPNLANPGKPWPK